MYNNSHLRFFYIVFCITLSFLLVPHQLKAQTQTELNKFQIEIYGGFATLNSSDFNLKVDYDSEAQLFLFDQRYAYLETINEIDSWGKIQEGERKKLTHSLPFGFRFKYFLSQSIAVSIGLKYFASSHSTDLDYNYTSYRYEVIRDNEILSYNPYSLAVKGYAPLVGIHYIHILSSVVELEGYLYGGPLFASCSYESSSSYQWRYQEPGINLLVYQSDYRIKEEGDGTGLVLDFGGRGNFQIHGSLGLFLELGYAYQKVNNLSGPGEEDFEGGIKAWKSEWWIKQENLLSEWGSIPLERPTNYPKTDLDETMGRDFQLDLSGFQLRIGILIRF